MARVDELQSEMRQGNEHKIEVCSGQVVSKPAAISPEKESPHLDLQPTAKAWSVPRLSKVPSCVGARWEVHGVSESFGLVAGRA